MNIKIISLKSKSYPKGLVQHDICSIWKIVCLRYRCANDYNQSKHISNIVVHTDLS